MASQIVCAATVVEYYNPDLDNYFITSDPGEQAFVDGGSVGRWQRTGTTFPTGGPDQVCRFYGGPLGPNSHFYTADSSECASLKSIYNPAVKSWKFESNDFATTKASNGSCASGLSPIYRAYNNGYARGVDSNHRISTNYADIQQVVARGWSDEGVVMCAGGSATTAPYNQTQSAKLLGGKWTFTYKITSTFSDSYSLKSITSVPNSDGDYYTQGIDAYGGIVVGAYFSKSQFWAIYDPGSVIDQFFTFTFIDNNRVTGCYYLINPPGSTNLSNCYAMTGVRTSTPLGDKASSLNSSALLSNKFDREDQALTEALFDTSTGFIEEGAVESYLPLRMLFE